MQDTDITSSYAPSYESAIIPDIDGEESNNNVPTNEESTLKNDVTYNNENSDLNKDWANAIDESESFNEENEAKRLSKYIVKDFKNIKPKQNVNKAVDMFKSITVDLNNIELSEPSIIEQSQDMSFIFNNATKEVFPVVCCQSGYRALLSGLTLSEKNAINNSNLTVFETRQVLYNTIYNKIENMGFKKPDFNTWLKITSFGDLDTLLFGIYCQTYDDNNGFDITCGNCKEKTSVEVNAMSMIEIKDKNVYSTIEEVISNVKSPQELVNHSALNKSYKILLNESKIIFVIKEPSLYDHLSLIKQSKQDIIKKHSEAFSALLFVKEIYMPNIKATLERGTPVYFKVTDKATILRTILSISAKDGDQLEHAIDTELGKLRITYEISNIKCSHCGERLPNIPVNMENVLFIRINKPMKQEE